MVMHARKPQRISDGYFEKHQTHPYQNSKYGSSKASYTERYNHERIRDSPNGNSYRSDTPDSESPRERSYPNKIYVQKIREKERERDYKSRDKYSECTRSPKEKRSRENRDMEHRTNHGRSSTEERAPRMGDWTEHISSSGKKYYYNCKTEISQWEKPDNWPDRGRFKEKEREDRNYTSSSRLGHEKHSNTRASNTSVRSDTNKPVRREDYWNPPSKEQQTPSQSSNKKTGLDGETQDMDISPGDSTPTSELNYSHREGDTSVIIPRLSSLGGCCYQPVTSTSTSSPSAITTLSTPSTSTPAPATTLTMCNVPGPPPPLPPPSTSATTTITTGSDNTGTSLLDTCLTTGANTTTTTTSVFITSAVASVTASTATAGGSVSVTDGDGPPTPTHSETQDGADAKKLASPPNSISSLPSLSQTSNVSSSLQALRQQGPLLTPSLSNYYRDDLVNHVRGWPAESLECQSVKLNEETHSVTSSMSTGVSAELKTARSIVRLTEINSTLNEQRILFLRQQIKTLEELTTQYSFMGSDAKL